MQSHSLGYNLSANSTAAGLYPGSSLVNASKPKSNAAVAAGNIGTSSTTSADGGVGATFLSLLAQELQNQDPTNPVDSTAMVGQMISLSELGQLISINQTLNQTATAPPTPAQAGQASPISGAMTHLDGSSAPAPSPSTAGPNTHQLPFDPNTMMPWNFGTGSGAASINSPFNPTTLGLYGTSNNVTGGK